MRQKKEKKPVPKKKQPVDEEDDTQSKDDDGVSISSSTAAATSQQQSEQKPEPSKPSKDPLMNMIGNGMPSTANFVDTSSIYDWKTFYETLTKISSHNFSGNQSLSWATIKL